MPLGVSGVSGNAAKLGLIAGQGELPRVVSAEASKKGYTVIGISLKPPADDSLKNYVDDFYHVRIGQFGRLITLLKKKSVSDIVLAGKVPKNLLYKNKRYLVPDGRALRLLFSLKDRSDDTIMTAIVNELEDEGFRIHNTTSFTKDLLCPERVLTRRKPSKSELQDIQFGWKMAKKMGQLDIGQTVVVKDLAVMAVEAIEGTDEAILRGGHLAESGAVVLKVSKPRQDMRFDVPVVGRGTLRSMKKAKAGVLAIEANKTIIVDIEKFIEAADEAGIAVAGVGSA
jgi:DUF1009 family protein